MTCNVHNLSVGKETKWGRGELPSLSSIQSDSMLWIHSLLWIDWAEPHWPPRADHNSRYNSTAALFGQVHFQVPKYVSAHQPRVFGRTVPGLTLLSWMTDTHTHASDYSAGFRYLALYMTLPWARFLYHIKNARGITEALWCPIKL
jgi:hypothetical protein